MTHRTLTNVAILVLALMLTCSCALAGIGPPSQWEKPSGQTYTINYATDSVAIAVGADTLWWTPLGLVFGPDHATYLDSNKVDSIFNNLYTLEDFLLVTGATDAAYNPADIPTDGQILKYSSGTGVFDWQNDATGAGGASMVLQEDDVQVLAVTDTLNFANGLNVVSPHAGQVDLTVEAPWDTLVNKDAVYILGESDTLLKITDVSTFTTFSTDNSSGFYFYNAILLDSQNLLGVATLQASTINSQSDVDLLLATPGSGKDIRFNTLAGEMVFQQGAYGGAGDSIVIDPDGATAIAMPIGGALDMNTSNIVDVGTITATSADIASQTIDGDEDIISEAELATSAMLAAFLADEVGTGNVVLDTATTIAGLTLAGDITGADYDINGINQIVADSVTFDTLAVGVYADIPILHVSNAITLSGDSITDFAGTGLSVTAGVLNATGGTGSSNADSIVSIGVQDTTGNIQDNYILKFDAALDSLVWELDDTASAATGDAAEIDSAGDGTNIVAMSSPFMIQEGSTAKFTIDDQTVDTVTIDVSDDIAQHTLDTNEVLTILSDADLYVLTAGDAMTGNLAMGTNDITGVGAVTATSATIASQILDGDEDIINEAELSTSALLRGFLGDETGGTGVAVFATNPTLTGIDLAGDITGGANSMTGMDRVAGDSGEFSLVKTTGAASGEITWDGATNGQFRVRILDATGDTVTANWPVDMGTNGYQLTTDGDSLLSWQASGSGGGIDTSGVFVVIRDSGGVDLASANEVQGILDVPNGGTGASTLTNGAVLLGNAAGVVQSIAMVTTGTLLIGDGAADPSAAVMSGDATITGGGVVTVVNDSHAHTATSVSGLDLTADVGATILPAANGGTGAATLTDGGPLLGSGTDAVTALGQPTDGQLIVGSTGLDPVLATLTGTASELTVTNGAGSITLAVVDDGHAHTGTSISGVNLGTDITGTLPIANGGTGTTIASANAVVVVAAGGTTYNTIALTDSTILIGRAGIASEAHALSGDATMSNQGVVSIAADSVGSAEIADGSVAAVDVAADVATQAELDALWQWDDDQPDSAINWIPVAGDTGLLINVYNGNTIDMITSRGFLGLYVYGANGGGITLDSNNVVYILDTMVTTRIVLGGDKIDEFAGDGLTVIANALTADLGTSVDSTEVAANALSLDDVNWQPEYIYLEVVHTWSRALEDSIYLSFPAMGATSSWLLNDSAGNITAADADTFMVSGVLPFDCTIDSVSFLYQTTTTTADSSKIDAIELFGPNPATGTQLADSSYFSDATDRNGLTWAVVHNLVTETGTAGDRFAVRFITAYGYDNESVRVGWVRLKVTR